VEVAEEMNQQKMNKMAALTDGLNKGNTGSATAPGPMAHDPSRGSNQQVVTPKRQISPPFDFGTISQSVIDAHIDLEDIPTTPRSSEFDSPRPGYESHPVGLGRSAPTHPLLDPMVLRLAPSVLVRAVCLHSRARWLVLVLSVLLPAQARILVVPPVQLRAQTAIQVVGTTTGSVPTAASEDSIRRSLISPRSHPHATSTIRALRTQTPTGTLRRR
jgi:hypothetical protein